MKIKINIDLKIGRIVKYFILADLLLLMGWGFLEPVFAVFVVERVAEATLVTVGVAAAIYWLLKSFLQLPIANYLDKSADEDDGFHLLIIGLLLAAFSAFSFSLVDRVWELYLVQAIHSVALALYVPSWSGIFSHHLDRDRASFDWSLDSTAVGIASGVSGILGGVFAHYFGFTSVFVLAALFSMAAALALLAAPALVLPRRTSEAGVLKDHTPANLGT